MSCALVKARKKIQAIYRTSGAPNTGKVIETAKEKARVNNRSGNRKKGADKQAITPASGGSKPHEERPANKSGCGPAPACGRDAARRRRRCARVAVRWTEFFEGLRMSLGAQFPD